MNLDADQGSAAAAGLRPGELLRPGTSRLTVKMCITANFLSVSVLIVVWVTDGAADGGELDLSGIDDSEIELVGAC